jgi:hypothetical protein
MGEVSAATLHCHKHYFSTSSRNSHKEPCHKFAGEIVGKMLACTRLALLSAAGEAPSRPMAPATGPLPRGCSSPG